MSRLSEIHVSMINAYKTCPRMYFYEYVEGLRPKAESVKLSLGRGFHKALAAFYAQISPEAARAAYEKWVGEEVPALAARNLDAQEIYDAAALGAEMLEAYLEFAAREDDFVPLRHQGTPAIEIPFRVPVWTPKGTRCRGVYYSGTFDGVVRDRAGNLWVMEHKTAQSFPAEITLRLDEQAGLYLLAAYQLLDEPPKGVIYNVVRKVSPSKARGEVVKRWKLIRTGPELVYMRNRLYYALKQIRSDKVFMPSPGFHCSWKCGYTQLCICEHDGADQRLLREIYYEKVPAAQSILNGEVMENADDA